MGIDTTVLRMIGNNSTSNKNSSGVQSMMGHQVHGVAQLEQHSGEDEAATMHSNHTQQQQQQQQNRKKKELLGAILHLGMKKVSLSGINQLPSEIGHLADQLESLELWHCSCTTMPPEIGNLQKLTYLTIEIMFETSSLLTLPPEFGRLQSLKCLTILQRHGSDHDGAGGVVFPKEMVRLTNLEELIVDDATAETFCSIPNISQLQNLARVELRGGSGGGGRPMIRIPESIQNLDSLQELRISLSGSFNVDILQNNSNSNAPLFTLPVPNTLRQLRNLKRLEIDAAGGGGIIIPQEVKDIPQLEALFLSNIPLDTLVSFFSKPWNASSSSTPTTTAIKTLCIDNIISASSPARQPQQTLPLGGIDGDDNDDGDDFYAPPLLTTIDMDDYVRILLGLPTTVEDLRLPNARLRNNDLNKLVERGLFPHGIRRLTIGGVGTESSRGFHDCITSTPSLLSVQASSCLERLVEKYYKLGHIHLLELDFPPHHRRRRQEFDNDDYSALTTLLLFYYRLLCNRCGVSQALRLLLSDKHYGNNNNNNKNTNKETTTLSPTAVPVAALWAKVLERVTDEFAQGGAEVNLHLPITRTSNSRSSGSSSIQRKAGQAGNFPPPVVDGRQMEASLIYTLLRENPTSSWILPR